MEIGVITNPNSRKNQQRPKRVSELQQVVGRWGEVVQTRGTEDLKPVLREFLRRRARFWVADGGDGSLHWMLREGLEVLAEPEFQDGSHRLPLTVPTNGGSIDFVAKNVGIRGSAETILERLVAALERGQTIEEVEVDALAIDAIEQTPEGEREIATLGFAVAAGGVGQRFFDKLFEADRHTSGTIVSIVAKTVLSAPVALTPLRHLPGLPKLLRTYAREVFEPTAACVHLDGRRLPETAFTSIHIASMSINLGGVFRFFGDADVPGRLHAIVGAPGGFEIIANVPRMVTGIPVHSKNAFDGPCFELTMQATGEELLAPVIDGEAYPNLKYVRFGVGPRVRIPKVVAVPIASH